MKFLFFIAIAAGLASSTVINPVHQGSDLESRDEIQNDAITAWAAPGSAVHGRQALVHGERHASSLVFKRQPGLFSKKWRPEYYLQDDEGSAAPKSRPAKLSPYPPKPPAGVDTKRLQVWVRINTNMYQEKDLNKVPGFAHAGLRQLTKDIGGKHTDLVIGRGSNWYMFGLAYKDSSWRHRENGDGTMTQVEAEPMDVHSKSRWIFKGVIVDPEINVPGSPVLIGIANSLSGGRFSHRTWNCRIFVERFLEGLEPFLDKSYAD